MPVERNFRFLKAFLPKKFLPKAYVRDFKMGRNKASKSFKMGRNNALIGRFEISRASQAYILNNFS